MNERKFALVLGATGGIGQAVCHQLASSGWSLYIHYNKREKEALKLRMSLEARYPALEFFCVQANFESDEGAECIAQNTYQLNAIVVANGQSMNKLLTETTSLDMNALWKVHVQNPARLISLLSNRLRKHSVSYIVFIGSIWGIQELRAKSCILR